MQVNHATKSVANKTRRIAFDCHFGNYRKKEFRNSKETCKFRVVYRINLGYLKYLTDLFLK